MDPNDRRDMHQSTNAADGSEQVENITPEEALRAAPPGSSVLNSSPPTRAPSDNPVRAASHDTGDILADEVREGRWTTPEEERDSARGS